MGDHNFLGDRPQHNGDDLGLAQRVEPLSEDSREEVDLVTAYPDGLSVMRFTAAAEWLGNPVDGTVLTARAGNSGWQRILMDDETSVFRDWHGTEWGVGYSFAYAVHPHQYLGRLTEHSETDPISWYPDGFSVVLTGANSWNGHTEATVFTSRRQNTIPFDDNELTYATQILHHSATNTLQIRVWDTDDSDWSGWQDVGAGGGGPVSYDDLTDVPSTFSPSAHAASHKGDGSDPIANATTSVSGLESAADKTKLDSIEAGATADQTASEILTAVKTVDGSGSGLDADTLDGHDTAYFAIASDLAAKADLVGGVVPTSQLPALAINDVFTVASQAAMLALTAQRGDIAVRTDFDPDRTYMLSTDSPGTLADWVRVTFGDVVSVNGQTGVIVLGYADVGAASTTDTRIPSQDENDALVGTNGTPSTSNKFVTNSDSRNTDTRTPTDDSVTNAKVAAAAAIAESKLNLASDAAAGTASRRTLGTSATSAAAGNDSRLSDSRTPTSHASSHTNGTDDIQSATASQKGVATAAQITKLDGIETAATADQTAAEILTAIKTVDGSGSGLDADTLDGHDTAYFQVAGSYTAKSTGTIGNGSSTSIAYTHNLGTRAVVVSVHDATTFDEVQCDVTKTDTNNVTVAFAVAPATNAYVVTVVG